MARGNYWQLAFIALIQLWISAAPAVSTRLLGQRRHLVQVATTHAHVDQRVRCVARGDQART